jgi:oxygen-independent coproporphyrinogen-3 oxidase
MSGLYLHIPYCRALCPYCDFAKTANVTEELATSYFARLDGHLAAWLERPETRRIVPDGRFGTLFVGGGTPSLYVDEYARIMERIAPRLAPGAEVTLEANPDDVTPARLAAWRRLGFNRISLGVQSFAPAGLNVLGRKHDGARAAAAVQAAVEAFPKVNLDLIYGWPGQTEALWEEDLLRALALGAGHLSLYTLTYEARTPLGRVEARGKIARMEDDPVADLYERARRHLAAAGYVHEEVSNWAKPGQSCDHNWLYWSDAPYLAVGAGAHGYFADPAGPGVRYAYPRSDRAFLRQVAGEVGTLDAAFGVEVDAGRTTETWLTELVGASLRTLRGVPLEQALARTGRRFAPTPTLAEGLDRGLLQLSKGALELAPGEWFRESAWALEVLDSVR